MRLKQLDDLLCVFVLLRGKVGVVQYPVVGLPEFMLAPQQIDRVFYQFEHFIASLNASGVFLNAGIRKTTPAR